MLSIMLLIHLALCNAQWPLQSIGSEEYPPIPRPFPQPGYPYNSVPKWAEPPRNKDLILPVNENANVKELLEALEPPSRNSADAARYVSKPDREWILERVKKLVEEHSALRNETDGLMHQLQYFYMNMAIDEADNRMSSDNSFKYGMSVILRFLLEFYRIFRKLSSSQSSHSQLTAIDVYGISYDEALDVMKAKKNHSPLQISIPIKRSTDIFKTILYESVQIVQTECNVLTPNWQCIVLYLANLISESINCPNVWYHAFVHLLALETKVGLEDSFAYKIADLINFRELAYFENIFDFIIEKLQEYREVGRIQLSAEAVIFTMLADLQENGFLDCISIDCLYN